MSQNPDQGRRKTSPPVSEYAHGAADTAAREVTNVPEELGKVPELIRDDLLDDEVGTPTVQVQPRAGSLREWLRTMPDDEEDEDEDDLVIPVPVPLPPEPEQQAPEAPLVVKLQPLGEEPLAGADAGGATKAPSRPRRMMLAMRALFSAHTALSMITNTTQELDELNNAFSAFAQLGKGEHGFVSVTFRRCHDFKEESEGYIALLHGDDSKMPRSRGERIRDALRYTISRLWFEANRGSNYAGSPPVAPWQRGGSVERPTLKDDASKQTFQDAVRKARAKAHYEVRINAGISGLEEDSDRLSGILQDVTIGFDNYSTNHQSLYWVPADPWEVATGYMPIETDRSFILSNEELGEIARIPDGLTKPANIAVVRARVRPLLPSIIMECQDPNEPPKGMIPIGVLGEGTDNQRIVGMGVEELNKHMFIAGATGTGKSVLMERIVFGCVKNGDAVVVLDPHGTFVDAVRDAIIMYAPERLNDVVVVDAADEQHPLAFNPIDAHDDASLRHSISSVMEMMRQEMGMTSDKLPRAINYATHAVTALAEANLYLQNPNVKCTLLNVPDFFQDSEFRQQVLALCTNPTIRDAYHPTRGKFETMPERQQTDAVMPVLSRFYPLGNSPAFANVFSAPHNKLDFEKLIREKRIILMKLGRFDTEPVLSKFMGNITIPYMLRSMHKWGRSQDKVTKKVIDGGVRMFVDEAHAMIGSEGSSAVTVLAEARKYNFGLVAATQFPEQLHPSVMKAFYGNTKSKICLALDKTVVGNLSDGIDGGRGILGRGDIVSLPQYYGYCNLLIAESADHVEQSGPFSVKFLGPFKIDYSDPVYQERLAQVERQSRMTVCNRLEFMQRWRREGYDELKTALILAGQERATRDDEAAAQYSHDRVDMPDVHTSSGEDEDFPWPDDDQSW
jgi:hypothetical protein